MAECGKLVFQRDRSCVKGTIFLNMVILRVECTEAELKVSLHWSQMNWKVSANAKMTLYLFFSWIKTLVKQDCIPLGCIPPAGWPYLPVCSAPGGCLVLGGGLVPGGTCLVLWGGAGGIPTCTEADPPLWTESQTPVKIWPCPNFVAGGKNESFCTNQKQSANVRSFYLRDLLSRRCLLHGIYGVWYHLVWPGLRVHSHLRFITRLRFFSMECIEIEKMGAVSIS